MMGKNSVQLSRGHKTVGRYDGTLFGRDQVKKALFLRALTVVELNQMTGKTGLASVFAEGEQMRNNYSYRRRWSEEGSVEGRITKTKNGN